MHPNGSMNSLQILLSKVRESHFAYARRFDFILTYKCGGLYEASWMWQVVGDGATGTPLIFAHRITLFHYALVPDLVFQKTHF
jgi:hypothetical protein